MCNEKIYENFLSLNPIHKDLIVKIIQRIYCILVHLAQSQDFCKNQILKLTTTYLMAKNFCEIIHPNFDMYYLTLFSCIAFNDDSVDVFNYFTK